MHTGRRYTLPQTLFWSRRNVALPLAWSALATALHQHAGLKWLGIPWLPMSLLGVAVAFYLGFKNNASYDRLWEARKIWGGIVNASRSWAMGARDLLVPSPELTDAELATVRQEFVRRHVAWMDALRHQLRRPTSWEHHGPGFDRIRHSTPTPESQEDLSALLGDHLGEDEAAAVLSQINPAAHLLSRQSSRLAQCRAQGALDGFAHMELQRLLVELMALQGKAERIKNFPFPRQYATVNSFFAWLFAALVPFGMLPEFDQLGDGMAWLTVPFATLVCWVFLTTDQIGEWSENPFEGLANDVPISTMARGIERDVYQLVDIEPLPEGRPPQGAIQF